MILQIFFLKIIIKLKNKKQFFKAIFKLLYIYKYDGQIKLKEKGDY